MADNRPALGSRVTIASASRLLVRHGYQGTVQSVIYGQTKGATELERCAHDHRLMRTALECGRAMLRARIARSKR